MSHLLLRVTPFCFAIINQPHRKVFLTAAKFALVYLLITVVAFHHKVHSFQQRMNPMPIDQFNKFSPAVV